MSKDYPVGGALRWTLSDENFAALSAVRDQITSVRFQGGLEIELDAMLVDYISTKLEGNSTANIVSEYYKNMLRILAAVSYTHLDVYQRQGVYQSLVGFVLVLTANFVVRKLDSENALF